MATISRTMTIFIHMGLKFFTVFKIIQASKLFQQCNKSSDEIYSKKISRDIYARLTRHPRSNSARHNTRLSRVLIKCDTLDATDPTVQSNLHAEKGSSLYLHPSIPTTDTSCSPFPNCFRKNPCV